MSITAPAAADSLQQIVACSRELYSLPRVAIEVLELTDRPNVDIPALRKSVEHDPALTTKVLRVVNSSLFGLSRQVSDLNHALTLLGVKPLKMLVLGFSLPPKLFEGLQADVLQQYWRRSIIKAVAAREIARRWGRADGEEMLIAGLLQDIGILVLMQQLGEPYCRFARQAWEAGNQLTLLERQLFGFDHTEVTARLLNGWKLPRQLVAAVRAPDQLSPACPSPVVVLWMAELTASFLTSGDAELLAALYQSLATWKNVPAENVESFLIDLQVQVEQLASVYSHQYNSELDYAALVAQAQQRLAGESQGLAQLLAIQAREVCVDRQQWSDLIASLENLPRTEGPQASPAVLRPAGSSPRGSRPERPPPVAPQVETTPATASPVGTLPARGAAVVASTDDASLLRQVAHAAVCCRGGRCSLSLMLVEIDRAEEVLLTRGVSFLSLLRDDAEGWLNEWLHTTVEAIDLGDDCFAVLLFDTERQAAVQVARRLMDTVSDRTRTHSHHSGVTLSVGVAAIGVPPKDFDSLKLVEAAGRCLDGARFSGGACLKSIEIF